MTSQARGVHRRPTIEVSVGGLGIGSMHPIRVQSMTTTNTMDTQATIDQSIRMIEAGCELVRITAPSIKEAKNLEAIRTGLRERGYNVPLVADIHFTPNAAEVAARLVEKVRVNPGNYADRKQFAVVVYDDAAYQAELDRIYDRFVPLVRICKEHGTAMRIGTNHGSLSDRIVNRYGDNPLGMVESALEFLRIAESESYTNIVLSMKSSNPVVMVHAYRLLAEKLNSEGLKPYPFHLGVTEAGDGEDGRIKSSIGIGALLHDGIGDTIRVSLTEEPEAEVPVAQALAFRVYDDAASSSAHSVERRHLHTTQVASIGGENVPRVFAFVNEAANLQPADLAPYGHVYDATLDKWHMRDQAIEFFVVASSPFTFQLPSGTRQIMDAAQWLVQEDKLFCVPCFSTVNYLKASEKHAVMNVVYCESHDLTPEFLAIAATDQTLVLFVQTKGVASYHTQTSVFETLKAHNVIAPVVLDHCNDTQNREHCIIETSSDVGPVFVDGHANGIMLTTFHNDPAADLSLAYGILQASRTRMSKTEYISCPSCGRTLFDLQETTAMIRSHTDHLKSVKIGIMGCIVNGPGEMADADYGYVGSGPDRITLYRGQELVKRNIPKANAVDELINIIKDDGKWIERESFSAASVSS